MPRAFDGYLASLRCCRGGSFRRWRSTRALRGDGCLQFFILFFFAPLSDASPHLCRAAIITSSHYLLPSLLARKLSIPTLSIVRKVEAATRIVTKRPSAGDQIRLRCKLGKKRCRLLFLACDTRHPLCTPLALNSQRLAIIHLPTIRNTSSRG